MQQSRTGMMCIFKQYSWNVCFLFSNTSNCASVFIVAVRETAEDFKKALRNKYDVVFFSLIIDRKISFNLLPICLLVFLFLFVYLFVIFLFVGSISMQRKRINQRQMKGFGRCWWVQTGKTTSPSVSSMGSLIFVGCWRNWLRRR